MLTAKSKPLHPMRGNRGFYFYNVQYVLPFCVAIFLFADAKLEKKEIECNLISCGF